MTDHDPIREAEAAILRARRGLDYMHQATNADRKLVRDALNEALAALAAVLPVDADTIEKAQAVVEAYTAWAEDHNDGQFAYYKKEDLMNACVELRAALAAVRTPEGQVPADTIEVARNAIERFVLCSDTRLRDGMSPDQWLAYQGLLNALAALRTPEGQVPAEPATEPEAKEAGVTHSASAPVRGEEQPSASGTYPHDSAAECISADCGTCAPNPPAASSVSAAAAQVPADTIKKALAELRESRNGDRVPAAIRILEGALQPVGHRFYCYGSHAGCYCAWRNEDRCPIDGTPKTAALAVRTPEEQT